MAKKTTLTVHKYRINTGSHVTEDGVRHQKGSSFWSSAELLKHNLPGEQRIALLETRERVSEADYADLMANGSTRPRSTTPPADEADDNDLTLEELKEYAKGSEIDISDCGDDAELIAERIAQAESTDA